MRAANFQQIHHFLKVLPFKYTEIKLTIGVKWVKTLVSSLQLTRKPIFAILFCLLPSKVLPILVSKYQHNVHNNDKINVTFSEKSLFIIPSPSLL